MRIFGETFVRNNKDKLKIEIDGEIRELNEYYYNEKIKNQYIEINLTGIEKIIDMSHMFVRCSSLYCLPDISKWNTSNVKDIYVL